MNVTISQKLKKMILVVFCSKNRYINYLYQYILSLKTTVILYQYYQMEQLISSRMQQIKQPLSKLENLSPEKFGRAAYADLSYTPSKLADNVIFREVSTMKKYEQGTNKLRQFEALNSFFKDRIKQIQTERDGIEQSLLQQIAMYKKMLNEVEIKNQSRIKEIQKSFNQELHKIIEEKEQQAKFAQSQKELLQSRIGELMEEINQLRSHMGNAKGQIDDLTQQKEKLQIKLANLDEKLARTEKTLEKQRQEFKQQIEEMKRKLVETENEWENKLKDQVNRKDKEMENLEKLHKTELQKLQNKRTNDELRKNQQLQQIRQTFQNEAKRLNEIINMKDRMIESLTADNNKEKAMIVELTKNYEAQINNLLHQKGRLLQQIQALNHQNGQLTLSLKDLQNEYFRQKSKLQSLISKLKEQLELLDLNFLRTKEQNQCLRKMGEENQVLYREVQNLRDLLIESSMEMEKCKEEFLKMGCEKDQLMLKLREMGFQRESLLRMKHEKEQEAKNWKDSYYMGRIRKA